VSEAKDSADRIVGEARTKAERLESEAKVKADRMDSDARTRSQPAGLHDRHDFVDLVLPDLRSSEHQERYGIAVHRGLGSRGAITAVR